MLRNVVMHDVAMEDAEGLHGNDMPPTFTCGLCHGVHDLGTQLSDCRTCTTLVCKSCTAQSLLDQVQLCLQHTPPRASPPPSTFTKGQQVLYLTRAGSLQQAVIVEVDRSIQPPQYGIQLPGADGVRFTEMTRLVSEAGTLRVEPAAPMVRCPGCRVPATLQHLQHMCPQGFAHWDAACTEAWLAAHRIIRCPYPECGVLIQRMVGHGEAGQGLHGAHASASTPDLRSVHREVHRFRCGACQGTFCDACRVRPYHEGLTCEQHAAPECMYCGEKVVRPPGTANGASAAAPSPGAAASTARASPGAPSSSNGPASDASPSPPSISWLKSRLSELGVDISWCLERRDLLAAWKHFGTNVCSAPECRQQLQSCCSKQLPCGHWCCGIRGEATCPPCLDCGKAPASASPGLVGSVVASSGDCCFCWEPLRRLPCIQMGCNHMCHLECARSRLKAGYPGPHISFHHLFCPLCRSTEGRLGNVQSATGAVHLDHPALEDTLQPTLELRQAVVALAKRRMKIEGLLQEPELQPGGAYDGRPADLALQRMVFYQCSKCTVPYFGGLRSCVVAAQQQGQEFNQEELVCGQCAAIAAGNNCPRHGTQYIEYKCKFCCSMACWFCWGTTHMCDACHASVAMRRERREKPCNPATCPLKVSHPQPGESCCLGCGMCRAAAAAE